MSDAGGRWLILADDLTGAADAAAAFRRSGYRSLVRLSPAEGPDGGPSPGSMDPEIGWPVVSLDLDARELPEESRQIRERLREAASRHAGDRRFYLKIDSTLRGPVRTLLHEFRRAIGKLNPDGGAASALVCPAFPAQGRVTRRGVQYLCVGPVEAPGAGGDAICHLADRLSTPECPVVPLRLDESDDALMDGMSLPAAAIGDAETAADLEAWARVGSEAGSAIWVGSAGLAAALARVHPRHDPPPARPPVERVIVVSGSAHPRAHRQLDVLASRRDDFSPAVTIVQAPRDASAPIDPAVVRRVVAEAIPLLDGSMLAGWVLVGGATARGFLDAAGTRSLEVGGEVEPGVPWLLARDGRCAGQTLVTKSGGFGGDDALKRSIEFLTSF